MYLRVREVASVQLLTEANSFSAIDSEIYARILIPWQEGSIAGVKGRRYFEMLSEESLAVDKMVVSVLGASASGPRGDQIGDADYRDPPTQRKNAGLRQS
jgi:hypothetical protein